MWGVYYVTMMYAKLKTHLHTADDLKTGQQSQIPRILWILQPNGSPHLALLGGWHQNNLETLTEQTSKFGKNVTPFLPRNFTKIPGFTPTPGPTKFSGQHLPASLVKDSTGRGFPLLAWAVLCFSMVVRYFLASWWLSFNPFEKKYIRQNWIHPSR